MKKIALLCLVCLGVMVLVGCTAGPNPVVDSPNMEGNIAGFWRGVWHGTICPITFLISLFSDSVHVYEVHNNGGWYNFGFLLGTGTLFRRFRSRR